MLFYHLPKLFMYGFGQRSAFFLLDLSSMADVPWVKQYFTVLDFLFFIFHAALDKMGVLLNFAMTSARGWRYLPLENIEEYLTQLNKNPT